MQCRAIIDVGTNSVKLLVAEVTGRTAKPLLSTAAVTRLGEGLERTSVLSPAAIRRTSRAVAEFQQQSVPFKPGFIRVLATSAARDAENKEELVAAIRQASGLETEIISGEKEAELVFRGVTMDPEFSGQPLMVFGLGGGSTEVIVGEGPFTYFLQSFPLGTLRLLEFIHPQDPPSREDYRRCHTWVKEFLKKIAPSLKSVLSAFCGRTVRLVGTGGTVAVLAKVVGQTRAVHSGEKAANRLDLDQVSRTVDRLWSLPLSERLKIAAIPRERADLILTGSVIFKLIMRQLHFAQLTISRRGMRYGALLEPSRGFTPAYDRAVVTALDFRRRTESTVAISL